MQETLLMLHQALPYRNRALNVGGSVLSCLKEKDKGEGKGKGKGEYTFSPFSEVRWKIWHWFRV
jgi:hypothetical protein